MKEVIQIKKYGNRRLYDIGNKRYITLDEIQEFIQNDYEVRVTDSKTGEDLTRSVLTQLILDTQKRNHTNLFTTEILHHMIQYQDQSMMEFFQEYLPNLLRGYMQWQQDAQNHFMQWARLGWSANQYSRDLFMPGFNFWQMGLGNRESDRYVALSEEESAPDAKNLANEHEIEDLKKKIEALEKRLNKSRRKD